MGGFAELGRARSGSQTHRGRAPEPSLSVGRQFVHVPTKVFVSQSHKDQALVEWLVGVLRRRPIPVSYSDTEIQGAQQWHDEIGRALKLYDWFVLVLSPNAVASRWVKREFWYTLQQDRFEGRIASPLHRECDYEQLSWILP